MTRIAIYARYSSDMQSDASIEDQIRLCKERAVSTGGTVIQCYTDHATSGASLMRPGIQMLMQDAASGKFDVVYSEALDRISRDQEDIAAVFKRLSFAGISIFTLSEGDISQLHIGLKGTMNAMFLKDLADKTRRGLRGRVENGRSGGGKCYGYDVVSGDDRGQRKINVAEATIVQQIFEDYAAGKSPRSIAKSLNEKGIKGPTGKGWGQSTINGNRQRGTGILNNELYIGRLVWNRLRYMKDPESGKRVSKLNPECQWIIHDVPEQQIIDDKLWSAVKSRQSKLNKQGNSFWKKQRPRYLLSSLTKCGQCGGGFSMISQDRLGCSTARNKGTCDNRLTIPREKLEQDVLGALKGHLLDPKLCAIFCDEFTKHMNKLRRDHVAATEHFRRELKQGKRQMAQMVDAIADGAPVAPIKDKMHALEARRVELEALLEDVQEAPPLLHPNMAHLYKKQVGKLIETLNVPEHRAEAADVVRSLVEKIVLTPDVGENRLVADLHGDLAGILGMATKEKAKPQLTDSMISRQKEVIDGSQTCKSTPEGAQQVKLVAGVGFEPTTFRL